MARIREAATRAGPGRPDRVPQGAGPGGKSLSLRHGHAGANKAFALMERAAARSPVHDPNDGAVAEPWFAGGGKGVLADFLVCTIDQVLMASLQMRHVALATVQYDGLLTVTDADAFRHGLGHGLGRSKGLGCGLMTVVPVLAGDTQ